MNINIISKSGGSFSQQKRRVVTETVQNLTHFFTREFEKSGSFLEFISEMEKIEVFKWLEGKKKMQYIYNSDILVEIDLLSLFRDYKIEQILKK